MTTHVKSFIYCVKSQVESTHQLDHFSIEHWCSSNNRVLREPKQNLKEFAIGYNVINR